MEQCMFITSRNSMIHTKQGPQLTTTNDLDGDVEMGGSNGLDLF
jgi:hypothetical protein